MNINTPVTNPNLVAAMKKQKQSREYEPLFWQELASAKLLCPVEIPRTHISHHENGTATLEKECSVSFLSLTDAEKRHFLMAFTDWDELHKWRENPGEQTLVLSIDDYLSLLSDAPDEYAALTLNPFGENIIVTKEMLLANYHNHHMAKGTAVAIGAPKKHPHRMVWALKKYFRTQPSIEAAYLLWMAQGDETSYLLVIDCRVDPEPLFPQIGAVCKTYLGDQVIDITPLRTDFGRQAVKGHAPFYQR